MFAPSAIAPPRDPLAAGQPRAKQRIPCPRQMRACRGRKQRQRDADHQAVDMPLRRLRRLRGGGFAIGAQNDTSSSQSALRPLLGISAAFFVAEPFFRSPIRALCVALKLLTASPCLISPALVVQLFSRIVPST